MYLIPPDETQLEHIKTEDVWRTAESVDEDVTHLIEWLSKQPHLPNVTDRSWLSHIIPGCKYNMQKTKQVIECYFIRRAEHPDFYKPFTMETLKISEKVGFIYLFPKLTPQGNRVSCTKSNPIEPDEFDVMEYCRWSITALDLRLKLEPAYGDIIIYDLENATFSQFLCFTPSLAKKLVSIYFNAFPLRLKSVHLVNPPTFVGHILMFMKMFCPPKIKNRIFAHGNIEDLHEHIPKDVLPVEYGGTNGTFKDYKEGMIKLYEANIEWLTTRPKADLSKIPYRRNDTDDLGVNGSFKQLQID